MPVDGHLIDTTDIEHNKLPWAMVDTYKPIDMKATIVNTDTSAGEGIHWIVVMPLRHSTYIYDPLGPRNKRSTSDGTPSDPILKATLTSQVGPRIHFYPYPSQMASNTLCGWHSIYVAHILDELIAENPNATTDEIDALIQHQFGKSAGPEDVAVLRKVFQ